ncbi:Zinc finger BED domain-containing protein RICESLEEPER 3 [Bienertia sinuspersici]
MCIGTSSTPIGISRVEEINNVDEVELDDDNAGDNANVEGNEQPKEVEITMHEHPFTTVEEEGFNLKMKRGIPQWTSVSRHTIRLNSFKVFEFEKKKLKSLFKKVDRISLTTDLWWSKPQKIEYMVLTAHFVDMYWKLQKTVLNFVHLPPPHKGANIADSILRCLHE